jgi:hypothetical protein
MILAANFLLDNALHAFGAGVSLSFSRDAPTNVLRNSSLIFCL